MADINAAPAGEASKPEDLRLFSIIIYGRYIAAVCSGGFTTLIGVILAYVKRGDARGTIFESHFNNAIEVFWIGLVIGLIAIPLWFLFFLGALVHLGLVVWYLYRSIKGLVRVLDGRAYT